ncbi:hypothetical protein ACSV5S_21640 [Agrobacterium deltaense]|uniref:hypothetical protein n=1 Tax=Agrobacterium deltaense TaxID=1183412 RepID=UPI003FD5D7D0
MHENPQLAASDIALMGTTILLKGMEIARPIDVVDATTLKVNEKRTIWPPGLRTSTRSTQGRRTAICLEHRSLSQSMRFRLR